MKPYDKQIGGTHYQNFKIQPSKFVIENELLYPEGCVIKYILRHRLKGKKQDLEKAKHFIDMIIERDYPQKDFLEEAEKEKKELEESYQESVRQTKERKEKEGDTSPLDSFSEDLQNSIKKSRRQTEERKPKDKPNS